MELIVLNIPETEHQQASDELDKHLQTFGLTGSDEELLAARADHTPPDATHAVSGREIGGHSPRTVVADHGQDWRCSWSHYCYFDCGDCGC